MIFKDIVNRSLVDLKNCDDEPIHVPGSIQPHGFLIASDETNDIVTFCSDNISNFLPLRFEQVLGKKISDIFDIDFETEIRKRGEDKNHHTVYQRILSGRQFSLSVHSNNSNIIIEGEPIITDTGDEYDLYTSSRDLLGYMENSYTLKELSAVVAGAIKNITGYDRVMIYRFDEDYNGEVIAESKEDYLESFFGLHYPHTDIPPQARELYIKNQLRIIGDVNYQPVSIFTFETPNQKVLDLGQSVLRSVSPIHIQYLQNMGVGATLTISLLHKGKLWGLIACHHYSPKFISHGQRRAAKLHGHFITSQIDIRLLNEENEFVNKVNQAVDKATGVNLALNMDSIENLIKNLEVLNLCNAAGISLLYKDSVYTFGITPSKEEVKLFSKELAKHTGRSPLHTDSIIKLDPNFFLFTCKLPGINYFPLNNENEDCLIWYRTETINEIHWAGDPSKAIEKDKDGLSPRKSFMLWKQKVKGKSLPWKDYDLKASNVYFNFLRNFLASINLVENEFKQKEISRKLKESNRELENINWISTHDLQEPLRKIRIMSSVILTNESEKLTDDIYDKIRKINSAAGRMQALIQDVLEYTRLKTDDSAFTEVNLTKLFESVLSDINDSAQEGNASISIAKDLPVIQGIPFLLKQLFLHLMSDSLKFARNHVPIQISVSVCDKPPHQNTEKDGKYTCICYKDNGIGFEKEFNEAVFGIFTKLNNDDQYKGTGIGLALCKKIMERHHGYVRAEGFKDQGASFYLYFPC